MIQREKLKEIILSNRDFILNNVENIIERENLFFPDEKLRKVVILYGIKRSGKTFILFDLFRKYKENSLYIDFEDERLLDFTVSDFDTLKEIFLELYPELLNKKKIFLLDEIQRINGWERFCRRIVEKENIKVFVAGSSSKIIPPNIHTSLRGRAWGIEVTPFSFIEYLKAKNLDINNKYIYTDRKVIVKKHFSEYMKWGGFPEVVFSKNEYEKKKIIKEYLSAIFYKDLVERFRINNITLLNTLLDRLFSCFSQKFSLTAFYKQYKEKFPFSKDSLYMYYKNFLNSMLIFEVKKFSESTFKRMRNPAKIYLVDISLARKVTSQDYGRILENIVFLELRREADEIFYFSEDNECDFIVKKNNKFYPYQVTFELTPKNKEREINGLILACKWLSVNEGIILTYDQEDEYIEQRIKIKIIPVWKWILWKKFG